MSLERHRSWIAFAGSLAGICFVIAPAPAGTVDWPRQIGLPGGKAVLYEPKVEEYEGAEIAAAAPMSVRLGDATEAVFGSVRFTGKVAADTTTGMATLKILKVLEATFPKERRTGADPGLLVRSEMPRWNIPMSLEGYHALLSSAREGRAIIGDGTQAAREEVSPATGSPPAGYRNLALMASFSPNAVFPKSGDYAIRSIRVPSAVPDADGVRARLRKALAANMREKGFVLAPESAASVLFVDAAIDIRERGPGPAGEGIAPPGEPPIGRGPAGEPPQGTLSLEIRDPGTGRRIWRGAVDAGLLLDASEIEKDQRVTYVIHRLLQGFPPETEKE